MANTYKNAAVVLTSTGATDLYTAPSNTRSLVQSVNIANVDGSDRYATVTWYDASAGASYTLLYNGFLPAGTSMNALDTPCVLEPGDIIRVQASAANTLHATASIMEQDPTTPHVDGSITTNKIADDAVTADKLASNLSATIICTSGTRPASPFEGQKIYQTDDNRELTYDSSAWVQTNSLGGWSTWTPQLYQNGNLTSTIPHARYTRIGDTAIVQGRLNATQAGTAGNQIEIRNLPYSAEAAGDYVVIGNAVYWDGTLRWLLHVETLPTATSIAFGYDSAPFAAYGGGRFGSSPSKAVASGHFISFATTYEIA